MSRRRKINIASALAPRRHIRLKPAAGERRFRFEARYLPIGKAQ